MARHFRSFCAAIPLMLLSLASYAQTFAAGQVWVNQRQSALAITSISSDGVLRGKYTNQAAGFDCKNIPFDATGWVTGDFITFQVKWKNSTKDCNSLTAWTGYYSGGTLYTKWDLVYIDATTKKPTLLEDKDTFLKK